MIVILGPQGICMNWATGCCPNCRTGFDASFWSDWFSVGQQAVAVLAMISAWRCLIVPWEMPSMVGGCQWIALNVTEKEKPRMLYWHSGFLNLPDRSGLRNGGGGVHHICGVTYCFSTYNILILHEIPSKIPS